MLTATHATRDFLPSMIRSQLGSKAVYPAFAHAVRHKVVPLAIQARLKSTAVPAENKTNKPLTLRNFFDDDIFPSPFAPSWDLMAFAKRMDLENDFLRKHFFYDQGHKITTGEEDNTVKISIDLPGVKLEDVNIELKDDKFLQINAERKSEKDGYKSEARFDKCFTVDHLHLDQSKIDANLTNGVLTITAPKLPVDPESQNVKKIEVKEG